MIKPKINITELTNYHLGILWSIGTYNQEENSFTIRHKNRYFLEQLKSYFDSSIYPQKSRTGTQYALKTCLINIEQLQNIGWTERNAEQRDLPILEDYKDFLRAYIELHSCLDYCTGYKRHNKHEKYYRLRLRIYGNRILIQSINNILHQYIGIGSKKEQPTTNNKTFYIAYTSFEEIQSIYNWVTGSHYCNEIWIDIDKKLKEPIKNLT